MSRHGDQAATPGRSLTPSNANALPILAPTMLTLQHHSCYIKFEAIPSHEDISNESQLKNL
jgi:hypothetical protein